MLGRSRQRGFGGHAFATSDFLRKFIAKVGEESVVPRESTGIVLRRVNSGGDRFD